MPKLKNITEENADRFDNAFHEWLEANGVTLLNINLSEANPQWNARIDLNQLKVAILQLIDDKASIEATREARHRDAFSGYVIDTSTVREDSKWYFEHFFNCKWPTDEDDDDEPKNNGLTAGIR